MKLTRLAVKRRVRKLLRGKYKGSCAPMTCVVKELKDELNAIGVAPEDHLIAGMNMRD